MIIYSYFRGQGWVAHYAPDPRQAAKPMNFGYLNMREDALRWQAANERVFTVDLEAAEREYTTRQLEERGLLGRLRRT